MLKILILNWRDLSHPRAGGAELLVDEVSRRWVRAGHEVTLFCAAIRGTPTEEVREGVSIVRRGGRFSVYRRARRMIRSRQWDLIVESVNTRPWFAARFASAVPIIVLFYQLARDVWFYEAPKPIAILGRYVFEPLWLRRYRNAKVITISESSHRDLRAAGLRDVVVVAPGSPDLPQRAFQKEPNPTLIFVGRLQRSKRPDHAVRAYRHLADRIPSLRLWMVGDGPMRRELAESSPAGVTVFGRVDEDRKWELLARAHLLVVPSVREGWGLVVSEAAVAGTPAVGYRVPGLVDSIVDGQTGWLCDPTPEALARCVEPALAQASKVGVAARLRAGELDWDETAASILDIAVPVKPVR